MLQASNRLRRRGHPQRPLGGEDLPGLLQQVRDVSKSYPGYQFIPGWFSWSNTIQLGKQVGATPNGRRAYEPINHGATPTRASGRTGP